MRRIFGKRWGYRAGIVKGGTTGREGTTWFCRWIRTEGGDKMVRGGTTWREEII